MVRRRYPMWGLGAMLAAFFVWTLVIVPAVWGGWQAAQDEWNVWQASQFVAHGWLAAMYRAMPVQPDFPLWPIILAPVRALSDLLGLSGGYRWYTATGSPDRSTAWLIYGPVCVLCAGSVLFAGDTLAIELGVAARRRILLTAGLALLAFYIAIEWGHPEDLLTAALLLWALLALHRGSPTRAGWLAGLAIVTNPVAVLALPVLFARLSSHSWRHFGTRMVVLPVVLLAPPFLTDPGATWDALGRQVTYTKDHATPLVFLAHHVGVGVVNAGPVRLVAVVLVGIGAFVLTRRRPGLEWAVFVCGMALLARQICEPVMNPYYLVPGLAVLAIVLAGQPARRALTGAVALVATIIAGSLYIAPWPYSLLVAATSAVCLWSAWPTSPHHESEARQAQPVDLRSPRVRTALAGACVLALVAGAVVYGHASSGAQTTLLAANWDTGPGTTWNFPWGTPPVGSVANRLYFVDGTQVMQYPTLAPFSFTVAPSLSQLVRESAASGQAVARQWGNLAWVAPSSRASASALPAHRSAAAWIRALAESDAPGRSMWEAGPKFCPTDRRHTRSLLGAPDYRIVLWRGCGSSSLWLDTDPDVTLQTQPAILAIGIAVDWTSVVTNPSGTKVLRVYVGWGVKTGIHVAVSGETPYSQTLLMEGVMELRPTPSGLRIWDPWWRYLLAGRASG
jgi:hypothetical protein